MNVASTHHRSPAVLRLGLIGCADVAWRRTLPALAHVPDMRLVAVGSRDPGKAARCAATFGGKATSYEGVLTDRDVDAVYLPLPAGLHAAWAERALRAGKHVLVEKPLTTSAADTARLTAMATGLGLVLMENMMFLHHPQHETVRALVAGGTIGELRAFSGVFTIPPRPAGDIRLCAALGGGSLLDQGVYPLRAAVLHVADPLEVVGAVLRSDGRVDVSGEALLTTAGGVTAHVVFGMDRTYLASYELTGSRGRITVTRPFSQQEQHVPTLVVEQGDRRQVVEVPAADQFANALRAFSRAVSRHTPTSAEAMTVRQAYLVDQIRERGRWVSGCVG